jgi:acetate kinase
MADPVRRALILNAGSSTLKWSLLADGDTEASGSETWSPADAGDKIGAILARSSEVHAVGHRVVHGGTAFREAVVLDGEARARLLPLVDIDPLHMKPALLGIDGVSRAFPEVPQILAFDTAFHGTMPEAAAGYGLPHEWNEKWGLRRFGFHGLSVAWSVGRAAALAGTLPARLVVCHLGSGCSVTAVAEGRSFDTTMGFSPLEGLVMGTRAGSVDPGLLLHLIRHLGVSADDLAHTLSERSGLLGLSGVSGDLRAVLAAADAGAPRARLAYDRFLISLRRAMGAAAGVLGGVDAVVYTGGIGENSARVRREGAFAIPGLALDEQANELAAKDLEISAAGSPVRAFVVRAREDLVIFGEVARLLGWT